MTDPDVFVILKDGDSHGTRDGTPLCVDLDERAARMTKVGRCVRYVSAEKMEAAQLETKCVTVLKIRRECEAEERARIVRWLKSYNDTHSRHALAERIERGEHESF